MGPRITMMALIDHKGITQARHVDFIGAQQPDQINLTLTSSIDDAGNIAPAVTGQEAYVQAADA